MPMMFLLQVPICDYYVRTAEDVLAELLLCKGLTQKLSRRDGGRVAAVVNDENVCGFSPITRHWAAASVLEFSK